MRILYWYWDQYALHIWKLLPFYYSSLQKCSKLPGWTALFKFSQQILSPYPNPHNYRLKTNQHLSLTLTLTGKSAKMSYNYVFFKQNLSTQENKNTSIDKCSALFLVNSVVQCCAPENSASVSLWSFQNSKFLFLMLKYLTCCKIFQLLQSKKAERV